MVILLITLIKDNVNSMQETEHKTWQQSILEKAMKQIQILLTYTR